ncbi:MAG: N-acetylmuramoyl-L-alanine amidase [Tenericutes bacterium]|nr:N-acetylmuramoyl-L-alanine amidase [Mycoplasmatota bacterium]
MIKIKRLIKLTLLLLLFLIIIISIFNVNASNLTFPLLGKTIYLDAGHGGVDNGATVNNVHEKDLNLQIVYKLKETLTSAGATVLLTRKDDNDISNPNALYRKKSDFDNRIKLINNSNADLYISIHQNIYQNKKYSGPQVFYVKDNQKLAEIIQNTLNKYLNTKRKVKTINNTYMYKLLKKKGILIECGFISNDNERYKLKTEEYQLKLSKIITEGIITYYS